MDFVAFFWGEAGMIRGGGEACVGEVGGDEVGGFLDSDVDDGWGDFRIGEAFGEEIEAIGGEAGGDAEVEIFSMERGLEMVLRGDGKSGADIAGDFWGSGGGEGEDGVDLEF